MINKAYSSKGKSVKVTFELPPEAANERVTVVGDFNDWNEEKHPLKKDKKTGKWSRTLALKPGQEYRFRYLADGSWKNEDHADRCEPNEFGTENCVIRL